MLRHVLLSIAASFLLSKRFHQQTYVILSAITLSIISLLSVGLPCHETGVSSAVPPGRPVQYSNGIVIRHPVPLTFPFYASINHTSQSASAHDPSIAPTALEFYQIDFFMLQLPQADIRTLVYRKLTWTNPPLTFFYVEWADYFLYYTFFFSLNLLGAIGGYWIGKATWVAKLLKRGRTSVTRHIDATVSLLEKMSLRFLVIFYVFLATVEIAQTVLGFPEYEVGLIARVFIVFLNDWAWVYFPFRIVLTLIIVVLIYCYTTPRASRMLFGIISLITLAAVIWNTYSLIILLA